MANKIGAEYCESIATCCGILEVGHFVFEGNTDPWCRFDTLDALELDRHSGFMVSGFVNNRECKAAYKELRRRYKLVYQSPVRVNDNSRNTMFMCVFDTRGADDTRAKRGGWPFK